MTSFNTLIQYMCQTLVFIYCSIASLKQFFNQKYRKFYSANMTLFTLKANLILLKYKENSLQSGLSFIIHLLSNVHNLLKSHVLSISISLYIFAIFSKTFFYNSLKLLLPQVSPMVAEMGHQSITAWKVSVFGNFLVCIFPHLDWIHNILP